MKYAWLVVIAACSGSSGPSRPLSNAPAKQPTDPRAYVLGQGVKRDYRIAAKLYAEACKKGCGDLAACRSYFDMASQMRGTVATYEDIFLVTRMCDRGDAISCFIAAFAGMRDGSKLEDSRTVEAKCDAGDMEACELELATDLGMNQSGHHEERMRIVPERLCAKGKVTHCTKIISQQWDNCPNDTAPNGDACIEWQIADWKANQISYDGKHLRAAWKRVQTACNAGDVDACEVVPGRAVPALERCDAGDFEICQKLAKDGDKHAASVACAGGIGSACTPQRPDVKSAPAFAQSLYFLREECAREHDKEACEQLEKATALPPCP